MGTVAELEDQRKDKPSIEKLRQDLVQVKADLDSAKTAWDSACFSGSNSNNGLRSKMITQRKALSKQVKALEVQIELEEEVDVGEEVSSAVCEDPLELAEDNEIDDSIPTVGQIQVVDDNAVPPCPRPSDDRTSPSKVSHQRRASLCPPNQPWSHAILCLFFT